MIKKYEWLLFDADDTLFHFDALRGLKTMFSSFGFEFTEDDQYKYKKINEKLWKAYQNHKITASQIKQQRFIPWSEQFNLSSEEINSAFLVSMCEICEPLDGATNLLDHLKNNHIKLGIITNGFTEWQEMRLGRLGLTEYFEFVITSEQMGVAKPHRAIFDHALEKMSHPSRQQVLMIGDNLHSDIKGGIDSELHTCWLNPHNQPAVPEIVPTYQIAALKEIEALI